MFGTCNWGKQMWLFIWAKYKCNKERPVWRAFPRATRLAVRSTDDSHKLPLISQVSLDGSLYLCARDVARAAVIPGGSQASTEATYSQDDPRWSVYWEREGKNELTMHIVKGSMINKVLGGREEDKQAEHWEFFWAMKLLCDTAMVDTCPLHMQTYRMQSSKSEP